MNYNIELTNPQYEMFQMLENKVPFPLFIGGYGCGKTEILVINTIRDVMSFPGCKIACYAPTHDLLDLNIVPRLQIKLSEMGIAHSLQKQKHILHIEGNRQIIFRSMDNPERIVAYEVYRSHVDEADLMSTTKKGTNAWNRIIARNRQKYTKNGIHSNKTHKNNFNQVSAYSTPESYKFTYKFWKKEPAEGYKYVRAPSSSNWTLDESFISNLRQSYTPEQCKAYLDGYWTNIFTGTVYSYFDRNKHNTNKIITPDIDLHIGADFNYGGSCCAITKLIPNGIIQLEEFIAHDTEDMVNIILDKYHDHSITMYPDSTGKHNSSNASMSDIAMLRDAGFMIRCKSKNPRITDRVNAVQRLLYDNLFKINVEKCPNTVSALEEQSFDEKTGLPEKISGPATIDDHNDCIGYLISYLYPIRKNVVTKTEFIDFM